MLHFLSILAGLLPAVQRVYAEVTAACDGGVITGDEAAAIGRTVAAQLGDVRITIRGRDVLRADAQAEILSGFARVARQVVIALRSDADEG